MKLNYIELLKLEKHIEGGYFAPFYKSKDTVMVDNDRYKSKAVDDHSSAASPLIERSAGTSIYFLLEKNDFSAWHRLASDEIWHYYDGTSPIDIHVINKDGQYQLLTLGNPCVTEQSAFQQVIKAGCWFAAEVRQKSSFGLVGCTVSPGFEYQDFELANRETLTAQYPKHADLISRFTRGVKLQKLDQSSVMAHQQRNAMTAGEYVKKLSLKRHVEGGYFADFYKSEDEVLVSADRYKSISTDNNLPMTSNFTKRSAGTSIYFLLENNDFSAWHRLTSDEVWHYYDGASPIDIHVIDKDGQYELLTLGNPSLTVQSSFQQVIKADCWFAAEVRDKSSFGLVGCTVSPGFEYEDFELADRKKLSRQFPQHAELISRLTRVDKPASRINSKTSIAYTGVALLAAVGLYKVLSESNALNDCVDCFKSRFNH